MQSQADIVPCSATQFLLLMYGSISHEYEVMSIFFPAVKSTAALCHVYAYFLSYGFAIFSTSSSSFSLMSLECHPFGLPQAKFITEIFSQLFTTEVSVKFVVTPVEFCQKSQWIDFDVK
jgi:hypothetical protein